MAYRKLGELSRRSGVPHLAAGDHLAQGARPPQEPRPLAAPDGRAPRDDPDADAIRTGSNRCPRRTARRKRPRGDELQQNVTRLIRTLPRKLRDALLLAGSGDYTYEQIGHILGVPVGTVKWRVSEARRVLKEKLAAMGHAYD